MQQRLIESCALRGSKRSNEIKICVICKMENVQGVWILSFIAMVGAIFAGLFKLISSNGCRIRCNYSNGKSCCDSDCDKDPVRSSIEI